MEYELRHVSSLLLSTEKAEQRARLAASTDYWGSESKAKTAKAWAAELETLRGRLDRLLSPKS